MRKWDHCPQIIPFSCSIFRSPYHSIVLSFLLRATRSSKQWKIRLKTIIEARNANWVGRLLSNARIQSIHLPSIHPSIHTDRQTDRQTDIGVLVVSEFTICIPTLGLLIFVPCISNNRIIDICNCDSDANTNYGREYQQLRDQHEHNISWKITASGTSRK